MTRPRFPSDEKHNEHRRKVKPHVRVHHSITNHPRTTLLFRDNDLLACWLRVMILASRQGAAQTNDTLQVSDMDLLWVSGRAKREPAAALLSAVCGTLGWSYTAPTRNHGGNIIIRNLAKKQGITPRKLRVAGVSNSADLHSPSLPTPLSPLRITEGRVIQAQKKEGTEGSNGGKMDLPGVLDLFNEFAGTHPGLAKTRVNLRDLDPKRAKEMAGRVSGHPDVEDWKTALEWAYASDLVMRGKPDRPGPWLNPRWLVNNIDMILLGTYGTGATRVPDAAPVPYAPHGAR